VRAGGGGGVSSHGGVLSERVDVIKGGLMVVGSTASSNINGDVGSNVSVGVREANDKGAAGRKFSHGVGALKDDNKDLEGVLLDDFVKSMDEALLCCSSHKDNKEVREVFFSLKDNKAPGPDGYSAGFFKKAWSIVGEEVTHAILSFFETGKLLKVVNTTTIVLIPKVPNPSSVKDFRPISCCNTIYKCISKIIANRIKVVLSDLVGPCQSAFVASRNISDNILFSQELLRNYHLDSGSPRCALKVDLMKAYDTVRWDFIVEILRLSGFPSHVVDWIWACMSTPKFSVSVNREVNGFFSSSRGLRQGDPMSPYLFVLAMEALSGLLGIMASNKEFRYHWRCEKDEITHLCFADDLLVFSRADVQSVRLVKECLDQFRYLSGLIPNPGKSDFFVCGVTSASRMELLSASGFTKRCLPVRYLGVPLISNWLIASDCRVLVDRIINRAKGWTS